MSRLLPPAHIAISQAMIDTYAAISGDFNPLHVDPEAAARTPFRGTIAHGCIPMEPIFQSVLRWLGVAVLPEGTKMTLRYLGPSRPGDTIHIEERNREGVAAADAVTVEFVCRNQRSEAIIEGRCVMPAASRER
jgi:3-hydroxybutyryl-CoA dehydratase